MSRPFAPIYLGVRSRFSPLWSRAGENRDLSPAFNSVSQCAILRSACYLDRNGVSWRSGGIDYEGCYDSIIGRRACLGARGTPAFAAGFQQEPTAAGRIKIASGSVFIVRAGATHSRAGRPGRSSKPTRSGPALTARLGLTPARTTRGCRSGRRARSASIASPTLRPKAGSASSSTSSAAWPRTCRAASPSSRPTPFDSKRRRRSSACAGPRGHPRVARMKKARLVALLMATARRGSSRPVRRSRFEHRSRHPTRRRPRSSSCCPIPTAARPAARPCRARRSTQNRRRSN